MMILREGDRDFNTRRQHCKGGRGSISPKTFFTMIVDLTVPYKNPKELEKKNRLAP